MKRQLLIAWVYSMAVAAVASGCKSVTDITTLEELARRSSAGAVKIMTKDSALYTLEEYILADSVLKGVGTVEKDGSVVPFRGGVPLAQIEYAQASDVALLKTMLAAGAVYAAFRVLGEAWETPHEPVAQLTTQVYYPGGGGGGGYGGSCPFISVWDGLAYRLEGEAFSVALGKQLEIETTHMLPDASWADGRIRLRVSNERPETHYINSVRVFALEAPPGAEVYPDAEGNFWPVKSPLPAGTALNGAGENGEDAIVRGDGVFWTLDAAVGETSGGHRDTILLTFPRPAGAVRGSLVIRAINTRLSEAAFRTLGRLLGDQSVRFVRRLDRPSGLVRVARSWTEEIALRVEVREEEGWRLSGRLLPEANEVTFAKVVRLEFSPGAESTAVVRLSTLGGLWRLDEAALDWSAAAPLEMRQLPLESAHDDRGRPSELAVEFPDSLYLTLLPPEHVDMAYSAPPPSSGVKVVWAAKVRGYLHEWPRVTAGGIGPLDLIPGELRVDFVEGMVGRRDILLASIYDEWSRTRAQDSSEAPR